MCTNHSFLRSQNWIRVYLEYWLLLSQQCWVTDCVIVSTRQGPPGSNGQPGESGVVGNQVSLWSIIIIIIIRMMMIDDGDQYWSVLKQCLWCPGSRWKKRSSWREGQRRNQVMSRDVTAESGVMCVCVCVSVCLSRAQLDLLETKDNQALMDLLVLGWVIFSHAGEKLPSSANEGS